MFLTERANFFKHSVFSAHFTHLLVLKLCMKTTTNPQFEKVQPVTSCSSAISQFPQTFSIHVHAFWGKRNARFTKVPLISNLYILETIFTFQLLSKSCTTFSTAFFLWIELYFILHTYSKKRSQKSENLKNGELFESIAMKTFAFIRK